MRLTFKEGELTTTVGELIKKLEEFDKNARVYTEGCDCIGNVVDVNADEDTGTVLIERDDSPFDYDNHSVSVKEKYKDRLA